MLWGSQEKKIETCRKLLIGLLFRKKVGWRPLRIGGLEEFNWTGGIQAWIGIAWKISFLSWAYGSLAVLLRQLKREGLFNGFKEGLGLGIQGWDLILREPKF